jgi:cyclohexa-1,5-dienecarbonyl-CoA hydratase
VKIIAGGPVREIVLAREPLNIIDVVLVDELRRAFSDAERDKDARVVLLRGEGKCFSAGADVRDHLPGKVEALVKGFDDLVLEMEESRMPVIAAVQGACLGGGCELALSADVAIASDDAVFGQPEVKLGVFPPVAVARFPAKFGAKVAADVVLTGRRIQADEALRMGLVSRVVPRARLEDEARTAAREVAEAGPEALRLAKRMLNLGGGERDPLIVSEETYLRELMSSAEPEEGLKSFLEKRKPSWSSGG